MPSGRYLDVLDLYVHAGRARVAAVGEARALPLPRISKGRLVAVFLCFRQPAIPGSEILYPPHQIIVVDAVTGLKVLVKPCRPEDFASNDPPDRAMPFGLTVSV